MRSAQMLTRYEKRLILFSLIPSIALFFYSYTQIDLDLTLNRFPLLLKVQQAFQSIGYFNRPLSTALYIVIVVGLFTVYGLCIKAALQKQIGMRAIWIFLLISTPILTFSYNAFSYDLFNYIFDAKIVTMYHQNPYFHRALDFPYDPMLHFMRWTHRSFPYGPIWLLVTVPLSYLGHQVFLPTFFLFKLFIAACFLGTSYYVSQVLKIIDPKREVIGLIFFAINPLILVESLVSSHNDIVMLFFMVFALFLLIKRRFIGSIIFFLLSIGTKFATAFVLPVMAVCYYLSFRNRTIDWKLFFSIAIGLMTLAVIAATINSGNFQPWYLLYILTFASLVTSLYYVTVSCIILSACGLLTYVPLLYYGNSGKSTQQTILIIMSIGIALSVLLPLLWKQKRNELKI